MDCRFEVLIVGMGPAGLGAAVELAQIGVQIAIVDENPNPGGQVYRRPPNEFDLQDRSHLGVRYRLGRDLIKGFVQFQHKIVVLPETLSWGFFEGEGLALLRGEEISFVEFEKMLLCEGAMERSIPFNGWTLPGIMTIGGLKKMILQQGILPGKRFVLAGTSPLTLSLASILVKNGGEIAALCEATKLREQIKLSREILKHKGILHEAVSYILPLLGKAIPTYRPWAVVSAAGDTQVREVTIARLDRDWKPIPGSEERIQTDVLAVSYGFLPLARLSRLCGCEHTYDPIQKFWRPAVDEFMRTSVPNIYTAGDSAGISGADLAELEGRIAAVHIAGEIGHLSVTEREERLERFFKQRRSFRSYASRLNEIFAVRSGLFTIMDRETIVCRCERITAGEILDGIEKGWRNINELKRTRIGMGPCQGRICESIVAELMRQNGIPPEESGYLNIRPPITPVPMSVFEVYAKTQ